MFTPSQPSTTVGKLGDDADGREESYSLSGLTADETRAVPSGRGLLSRQTPSGPAGEARTHTETTEATARDEPATVRSHGKAEAQPCTSQFPRALEAVEAGYCS